MFLYQSDRIYAFILNYFIFYIYVYVQLFYNIHMFV